jgi:very-short-patch-repair endonuclease
MLIVEVDGPIHDYTAEEDSIREAWLEDQGFQVLRFTNQDVLHTTRAVLERIGEALHNRLC